MTTGRPIYQVSIRRYLTRFALWFVVMAIGDGVVRLGGEAHHVLVVDDENWAHAVEDRMIERVVVDDVHRAEGIVNEEVVVVVGDAKFRCVNVSRVLLRLLLLWFLTQRRRNKEPG